MALSAQCAGFLRMFVAFLGVIFLLAGIALQFAAAGSLYGIRLSSLCTTHSGSGELSDATSFNALINAGFEKRTGCLQKVDPAEKAKCCSVYDGLCEHPEIIDRATFDQIQDAAFKMDLVTDIFGEFIGVSKADKYDTANPEFWCKNCPDDARKNCPFVPIDIDNTTAGVQIDRVCDCPGGKVSTPATPFWDTITDDFLSIRYVMCSDQADVYEEWIKAVFPRWELNNYAQARARFETKCWQNKGSTGYILTIGPSLALFAGIFSIAGFFSCAANSPVPVVAFNLGMVSMAIVFVAFWALSLTGASTLISRYALCHGYSEPIVVKDRPDAFGLIRHAPELYNGSPCADLNSNLEWQLNPFISELGAYNGGYFSGGVLVILSLILMLGINAKVSDVVMEKKLAGDGGQIEDRGERLDD